MPKKGPAYPVSDKWRKQVREAVDDLIADKNSEIDSDAAFARAAGMKKNSFHEAITKRNQTPMMPEINAALGWRAPRVLSTPDELEIWAATEALDDRTLGKLIGIAEERIAKARSRRT